MLTPAHSHHWLATYDICMYVIGGRVLASSSSHYSLPANMIKPGRGINMGDGWETIRNRPALDDGGKTCKPCTKFHPCHCHCLSYQREIIVFEMKGPALNYNWTIFQLGTATNQLQQLVIDTLHFKNNPPVAFKLEYCNHPSVCIYIDRPCHC
jgi:allantoicase